MRMNFKAILLLAVGAAAADVRAGDVSGKATYDGPKPKPAQIQMGADPKCAAIHGDKTQLFENEVVGAAGEVKNVFVWVKNPPAGAKAPPPAEHAELNQKGCMYAPRVQGMIAGQTLDIVNSDDLLHNIRCMAEINKQFNYGQPQPGKRERVMAKAERAVKFKCDVHPWMTAYIFVMESPFYAVTGEDGAFTIKGLPAGEYTIGAWHEVYGETEAKVKVADGAAEASFVFHAPTK